VAESPGSGWLVARVRSFANALRGTIGLVSTQANARIHALATLAVIGLGLATGIGRREWAALLLATALVWAAEALNTALETLADALHPERHPLIGRAKDVAAAGVLLAALGAALVGLLVLGPPLLALVRR
jgi:diacylglycerol kinase (ATP)